jgi:hypothetical protein
MQRNTVNNHELLRWVYVHSSPLGATSETLAISFDEDGRMLKVIEQSRT